MANKIYSFFAKKPEYKAIIDKTLAMFPDKIEEVSPQTVYKAGNSQARKMIVPLMRAVCLPGSRIINAENLKKLFDLSQQGHSCLLLAEHYTNFDLSNLCYLTDTEPLLGPAFADRLIAMAGIKLSQSNPFIAAWSGMYNRIVIYPSRSLNAIENEEEREKARKLMTPINLAAMKELTFRKYNKQMVLVFPSGTRIRPWDKETQKGVREIYSYIKSFEYLCFLSINGNNLPLAGKDSEMEEDEPQPDVIVMQASKPMLSKAFLSGTAQEETREETVERVMRQLFGLHAEAEPARLALLDKLV